MRIFLFITLLLLSFSTTLAQRIDLVETKGFNENNDLFFYKIDSTEAKKGEYLGSLEILGIKDSPEVFEKISKKAKTHTGANAYEIFAYKSHSQNFEQNVYQKKLYHLEKDDFTKKQNICYIFNQTNKNIKVKIDNQSFTLRPKQYIEHHLEIGKTSFVSVGGFLGSNIKLQEKEIQDALFFGIQGASVKPAGSNASSIGIKTGDINRIEKSFALFLLSIYQKL